MQTKLTGLTKPADAVFVNDLNRYNPADDSWTALAPRGVVPLERGWMGFAAGPDGLLYTFGGTGGKREDGAVLWM
jgi:N-acetylneuraminic acid mutarotase